MARELSPTLEAAQIIGAVTWPYLLAKIRRKWGGVIRHDFVEIPPPSSGTEILRPNADGTETGWTPLSGSDNYAMVDEAVADDDTSYLYQTVYDTWTGDLYTLPVHSEGSGTINKVTVHFRWRDNGAASNAVRAQIRTGGVTYEGDTETSPNDNTYHNYSHEWATNPGGGAWTWEQIDALEVGVDGWRPTGNAPVCTQVYVEIDYVPATEDDYLHTAVMPTDGCLIRLRVANPDTTKDLYYQRVTNPDEESDFNSWSDLSIADVIAVASCSNGADISQFYVDTAGDVYQRISSDSGASWGGWSKIIDLWGYGCLGMDAAYKPDGDIALAFLGTPALLVDISTGEDGAASIGGLPRYCQSFSVFEDCILEYVKVKLWRQNDPGTVNVDLYEADVDGYPTGDILATVSFAGSTITDSSPGEWYTIDLANTNLDHTKKYAIVVRCPSGDAGNTIEWQRNSANPYADGYMSFSNAFPPVWSHSGTADAMLQVYASKVATGRPLLYCYFEGNGATWTISANTAEEILNTTGISIFYSEDWNLIATYGAEDELKGIKAAIYGDGERQASGTWSAWEILLERETTEPFDYGSPFVRLFDTTRFYFVEHFTQAEIQHRIFYSHTPLDTNFSDYSWLEPVPIDAQSEYGLCPTLSGSYAWLTNACKVYRALATDDELDISAKILVVDMRQQPDIRKGKLILQVDNTAGIYNSFARLGDEITIGLGFKTSEGDEYSLASSFWITKHKLVSPSWSIWHSLFPTGILGTLEIEAQDAWDFLARYKARRLLSWEADEKSVLELLKYFLGRSGLTVEVESSSDAIVNFKPAFQISRGTSYRTAVKNLLKMVPDQLIFREYKAIVRNPTTAEPVDWTYHNSIGTALLVFRGQYGTSTWDPNRAEVWGDSLMVADGEYAQIQKTRDRLSRITEPTYPDVTRAGERAAAELRKSEIMTGEDSWLFAMVNCGLEPWDKIQITDQAAGVSEIIRRVIRIKTYWTKRTWQYTQILTLGAD